MLRHYLTNISADKKDDMHAIVARMKAKPLSDVLFGASQIRQDGLVMHRLLLLQSKAVNERDSAWDYFKIIKTIPSSKLYLPELSSCVQKSEMPN